MEVDQQPSVSQDDRLSNDIERCFLCKKFCNKRKRTAHKVTATTRVTYGISESDFQPNAVVCLKCHFKHINIKSGRTSIAQEKSIGQIVKGDSGGEKGTSSEGTVSDVTKSGKTVLKNIEHSEAVSSANSHQTVCNGLNSKEPVCDEAKTSELAHNEVKNSGPITNKTKCNEPVSNKMKSRELDHNEIKSSEPVLNVAESSETVPNRIKSSEPVLNIMESSETVSNEIKSSEPDSDGKYGKQTECSAMPCTAKRDKFDKTLFVIPGRFFTLPPDTKQIVKSQFGLVDESKKLCKSCYKRVYWRCIVLTKAYNKIEIPSCSDKSRRKAHLNQSHTFGKQKGTTATKTYACGWCKFRSVQSSDVVKHHYKEHQRRELDIVRLKSHSPKLKSPSGIGFNCDSCHYTGRLRHQLHLHNDRYHKNALNRDGTTDYDSDSLVNPSYLKNTMLPSSYFQLQQKYKIKDVKISCEDILKSGVGYLIDRVIDEGISKLCVDNLTEYEFVSMATMYREDVSYCDTRVENYVPVDMGKLEIQEIESVVRN